MKATSSLPASSEKRSTLQLLPSSTVDANAATAQEAAAGRIDDGDENGTDNNVSAMEEGEVETPPTTSSNATPPTSIQLTTRDQVCAQMVQLF